MFYTRVRFSYFSRNTTILLVFLLKLPLNLRVKLNFIRRIILLRPIYLHKYIRLFSLSLAMRELCIVSLNLSPSLSH